MLENLNVKDVGVHAGDTTAAGSGAAAAAAAAGGDDMDGGGAGGGAGGGGKERKLGPVASHRVYRFYHETSGDVLADTLGPGGTS